MTDLLTSLNKAGLVDPSDPAFMPNTQPEPPYDPLKGTKIALEALKKNPKASPSTIAYLEKMLKRKAVVDNSNNSP